MSLLVKECAVCGKRSLGINCVPLSNKQFLCASCDRAVRCYLKEATDRKFVPPARFFDPAVLKSIVNGETPRLSLPGDDQAEEAFQATGAVGTAVRYNDSTRKLLIRPHRDITGMNVYQKGKVIEYDDIDLMEIVDSDHSLKDVACSGKTDGLALLLKMKTGSNQTISFLTTQQNRKSYAYRQALKEALFLKNHLQEMGVSQNDILV